MIPAPPPNADKDGFGIYPREILAMIYRRRTWLILPVLFALAVAAAMILLQKPMYRSSATLLIDTQTIPTTVVASPLTNIANDRIAKIRQQITSRDRLTELIARRKLYPEETAELGLPNVLQIMRDAISVDLVSAAEANSGQGNTIAFTLSFTYRDARIAQAVARDLTDMFLVEDKRFRTTQASGTAAFLGRRAEELRQQLTVLEDKRRAIKDRYTGALPEQIALNAQSGAALRAEVSRIDAETQGLMQQNSLLAARDRELGEAPTPAVDAARRAEERLTHLVSIYSDTHPDVIAARDELDRQQKLARAQARRPGASIIETEISSGRSRIDMLANRRSDLVLNIADMEHRAALGPQASYELNAIDREYENIKRQYESLREKQLDAQVAANLQSEDKGERFSIVDEPGFPHDSLGKKPKAIVLNALLAGVGLGILIILVHEFHNGTIHGEGSLGRALNAPPMAIIPVIADAGSIPNPLQRAYRWLSSFGSARIREAG